MNGKVKEVADTNGFVVTTTHSACSGARALRTDVAQRGAAPHSRPLPHYPCESTCRACGSAARNMQRGPCTKLPRRRNTVLSLAAGNPPAQPPSAAHRG